MTKATGAVFEYSGSQWVRLTPEAHFPKSVKMVNVRLRGNEVVLAPAEKAWDSFFFGKEVSEDYLEERPDQN